MIHKGIFFGLATVDLISYLSHYPAGNEKVKAERQLSLAGGPATNAAIAFAAFGNDCTLVTGLGIHPLTQLIKQDISSHQVNLFDCTDQPERPPVLSSILVNLSNGERAVVYSNTDVRKLKQHCFSDSLLDDVQIILFDGYYLDEAKHLAKLARSMDIITILDGGSWKQGLEELLPFIDYAVCSNDFIPPECNDSDSIITFLQSNSISNIAITRGDKSILACCNDQRTEIPVMKITVLDTLGAGDIFHGAFCHYILQNDFITSLGRAAEVASLSCASLGTRTWIEQEIFS